MGDIHTERVLILDFGSQYTQLIARRVREIGVYCEIYPFDWPQEELLKFRPKGVILSGGPESAASEFSPKIPEAVFRLGVPVLGICYGMQAMACQLGGKVAQGRVREFGYAQLRLRGHSRLLEGIEDHTTPDGEALLDVWMSHGDQVVALPPGFKVVGTTEDVPIAAMADEERRLYGLQFHPEVTHTRQGRRILERFLLEICGCRPSWTPANIIEDLIARIRKTVGKERVLLALSGGVDSSVVASLMHRAIGDQLTCVFVDTGLLRKGEAEQVMATFARHMGIRVVKVDASDRYFQALKGVADPEEKRRIIGHLFIEIFEEEAKKMEGISWLAQGTIYSDVIESAATRWGKTALIKSHHNVAALPEKMGFKLIEPLRELFKDEVRRIGLELGLPYEMIYRHPFPGPGLGVRVLGEVRREFVEILRQADQIFIEELRRANLYEKVSQAFAVFLPVRSVGVAGDARVYGHVIALRAVETSDFMTARWAHLPYDFLERVSRRIVNEVEGVSRVVYDISGKPPATIEWE